MAANNIVEPVGPFFGLDELARRGAEPLPEEGTESIPESLQELAALALLGSLLEVASDSEDAGIGGGVQLDIGIALGGPDGPELINLGDLPPDIRAILGL